MSIRLIPTNEMMNKCKVYAVWREYPDPAQGSRIIGYVNKTDRNTWQIDVATRYYGQRIEDVKDRKEAEQKIKEYWA